MSIARMGQTNISARSHLNGWPVLVMALAILTSYACSSTNVELGAEFPIPLIEKKPVRMGIYLDEVLTNYVHQETIEGKGDWQITLGTVQEAMFTSLALGVFAHHRVVANPHEGAKLDGILQPSIQEVQLSIPAQTRSKYFEVWIKYQFKLYDEAGDLVGEWMLPAYGKAHKQNHRGKRSALEAAAIAASRDAIAMFSLHFESEPVISDWLKTGIASNSPNGAIPTPLPGTTGD